MARSEIPCYLGHTDSLTAIAILKPLCVATQCLVAERYGPNSKAEPVVATPSSDEAIPTRRSIWPVVIAPLAAGIYYLAIRSAFAQSVVSVLGRSDLFDLDLPRWGSHWIYRIGTEVIGVGFGTFIAAGLAPGRERVAAIVGGSAISLGFIAKLTISYLILEDKDAETVLVTDPWYQHAIDAATILAAPIIGAYVAEAAEDMHRETPTGVVGINRLHFIWLWLAAYWYALGLITPVARAYAAGMSGNLIDTVVTLLVNGIPAVAIAVPGYYGITFLAGHHGDTMHPAGRNLVGVLVLIFGFFVGVFIQYGWYWSTQKIYEAIFG